LLAIGDDSQVVEDIWHVLNNDPELPDVWYDFFDHHGPAPIEYENQRAYHRFYLRCLAIAERSGAQWAVLTKDVSRMGIGFYVREQLFPCERARLWLPNGIVRDVVIVRCRRVKDHCYECGARFVAADE